MTDWPAVRRGFVTAFGLCSGVALIVLFLLFGSVGLWALDVGDSGFAFLASVFSGLLVILVSVSLFVPVVAGLCGGVVASYRSAGGLRSGCWHGLLAGVMSGGSVSIGFVVLQQLVQQLFFSGPLLRAWWSLLPAMGVLFLLTAIPSVIAGGAGGRYRRGTGERTLWWKREATRENASAARRDDSPLARLQRRYVEGELTDDQFERKLEQVLQPAPLEDGEDSMETRGSLRDREQ